MHILVRHHTRMKLSKALFVAVFTVKICIFSTEIEQWYVEDRLSTGGETAICPKCHTDSVLSDRFPIFDKKFLSAMKKLWFF